MRMKLTTTPQELKELQKEIKKLQAEKEEANTHLDYETAAAVGDSANKLKDKYAKKESAWRDNSRLPPSARMPLPITESYRQRPSSLR